MPRRTDSHVIADIAATRVASIFSDCGWACQTVEQDYGEDLFIQTKVGERVDPHRLWIQVKGTRSLDSHRRSDGDYNYRVTVEHVRKWIRSTDLVAIVLYDIERDHALWTLPSEQIGHWQVFLSDRKTIAIRFKATDVFDRTAAERIGWLGRLGYYLTLLTVAEYRELEVARIRQAEPNYAVGFQSKAPLIAYDFLDACGFIQGGSVDPEFVRRFTAVKQRFRTDDPSATDHQVILRAASLCFLAFIKRVTYGCALAEPLLLAGIRYGLEIMAHSDPTTYEITPPPN